MIMMMTPRVTRTPTSPKAIRMGVPQLELMDIMPHGRRGGEEEKSGFAGGGNDLAVGAVVQVLLEGVILFFACECDAEANLDDREVALAMEADVVHAEVFVVFDELHGFVDDAGTPGAAEGDNSVVHLGQKFFDVVQKPE